MLIGGDLQRHIEKQREAPGRPSVSSIGDGFRH
jgi:hypothetical protein